MYVKDRNFSEEKTCDIFNFDKCRGVLGRLGLEKVASKGKICTTDAPARSNGHNKEESLTFVFPFFARRRREVLPATKNQSPKSYPSCRTLYKILLSRFFDSPLTIWTTSKLSALLFSNRGVSTFPAEKHSPHHDELQRSHSSQQSRRLAHANW